MFALISKVSHRNSEPDQYLNNPPFPLAGAALGLIAVVNVTSTMGMLMSV